MSGAALSTLVELVELHELSPRVLSFKLSDPSGALSWQAGQYVELVSPDDGRTRLPYSIASPMNPATPGVFELAVARDAWENSLSGLSTGRMLELFGPYSGPLVGHSAETEAAVFIANGTGVVPLKALLEAELGRVVVGQAPLPCVLLLYGCRNEQEILWGERLVEYSLLHPRFSFEVTLTQPSPDWSGRRGRVQVHLRELVSPLLPVVAYVCGNPSMVSECRALLTEELGVDPTRFFGEAH